MLEAPPEQSCTTFYNINFGIHLNLATSPCISGETKRIRADACKRKLESFVSMALENKSLSMYARRNWFSLGKHCSALCYLWNVQHCPDKQTRFIEMFREVWSRNTKLNPHGRSVHFTSSWHFRRPYFRGSGRGANWMKQTLKGKKEGTKEEIAEKYLRRKQNTN